jgi:hypothetical protein
MNGYAEPEIRYGHEKQGLGSLVNTLTRHDDKSLSFNCKLVKEFHGPERLQIRWVIMLTRDVQAGEELYCYYGVNAKFAKPQVELSRSKLTTTSATSGRRWRERRRTQDTAWERSTMARR